MKKMVKIKRLYSIDKSIDMLMDKYKLEENIDGVFGVGLGLLYGLPKGVIRCFVGVNAKIRVLDDSDFDMGAATKSLERMKSRKKDWTIRDVMRIILRQIDKRARSIEDFINRDDRRRKTVLMGQKMVKFLQDNEEQLKPWGEFDVCLMASKRKQRKGHEKYNQIITLGWDMPEDKPHWDNAILDFIMADCYSDSKYKNECVMKDFYILKTILKSDIEEVDRYVRTFLCMLNNFPNEDYPAFKLVDGGLTLKNWKRGDCAIDLLADDNGFIRFESVDKLDLSLGLIAGR